MESQIREQVGKVAEGFHSNFMEMARIWSTEIVFTWRWWFELIAITIIPWVIWFIVRKKEETHRLLYAGFFIAIVAAFLDMAGLCFHLWYYPYKLVPFIPQYVSWDFSGMPVSVMLFLQFCPRIKPWIKALIYSAAASFIVQPVAVWMVLYSPVYWKHWYSFPLIFIIYMSAHCLYKKSGSERSNVQEHS